VTFNTMISRNRQRDRFWRCHVRWLCHIFYCSILLCGWLSIYIPITRTLAHSTPNGLCILIHQGAYFATQGLNIGFFGAPPSISYWNWEFRNPLHHWLSFGG